MRKLPRTVNNVQVVMYKLHSWLFDVTESFSLTCLLNKITLTSCFLGSGKGATVGRVSESNQPAAAEAG